MLDSRDYNDHNDHYNYLIKKGGSHYENNACSGSEN